MGDIAGGQTGQRAKCIKALVSFIPADHAEWRERTAQAKARGEKVTGAASVSGQIRLALQQTRRVAVDHNLRREVREALHGVLLVIEMMEGGACSIPEAIAWLKQAREHVRPELLGE